MNENTDILHEAKRLRLLAAVLELQYFTRTEANVLPIPGGDRVIAIGTPAQVRAMMANDVAPRFGAPIDAMSDDDLWHIAVTVNQLAGDSLWNVSQYDCVTAIRASFMDPDSGREYEKARAAALEGGAS